MAESLRVLIARKDVESAENGSIIDESIQNGLAQSLPEYCSMYFKDGCEVSVDGKAEPQKLIEIAHAWNQDIQDNAKTAIQNWAEKGFSLNSMESFIARRAIQAADNYFNANGMNDHAVVDPYEDFSYFSVLIEPLLMREIEAFPENFVILSAVYDF